MMRAALCIWVLSAVVCVGRSLHHVGHHGVEVQTDQDTALNSVSLVSSANKGFTYHLYRKLAAHSESQGKNIFFSPKSVSVALAALSVGARGETHQQLFNGLGFNSSELTQANVDEAFKVLLEQANKMSHQDTSEGTAVFVDRSFTPNLDFLDVLKKSYLADGFSVNFTNTVESVNTINSFVAEKTKGKIDELVESLDADTIMYLISYIYFKGKTSHHTVFGFSLVVSQFSGRCFFNMCTISSSNIFKESIVFTSLFNAITSLGRNLFSKGCSPRIETQPLSLFLNSQPLSLTCLESAVFNFSSSNRKVGYSIWSWDDQEGWVHSGWKHQGSKLHHLFWMDMSYI